MKKSIEKIKQALGSLKSLPNGVLEKMTKCLDDLVYEDHRIEIEHKKYLERKLRECDTKQERWHEMYAEASITRNTHSKKIKELAQEKEKIAEQLLGYSYLAQQNYITLKYLTNLYFYADKIWDFPKNEQKQKILKLLCSEILLDGKNIVISMRKPISALAEIGSCQTWQRKLYDLRKKYADELTELYPIVQSLENDPQVQKILKIN